MPSDRTRFEPPFCPNADCVSHASPGAWCFVRKGFYHRDRAPRRVQRYRCSRCGRNFSSQTFSTTYWLKRPGLLQALFMKLVGGSCLRQIAREVGVAHSTIQHQAERLGRHCLLFGELHRPVCPREPVCLDGFRSFEHSQYWPMDLNLVVGPSLFFYAFGDAPLRRSGTMTSFQRRKRARLEAVHGRPDPKATRKSVEEVLARVVPAGASVELHTDRHRAYPAAIAKLADRTFHHRTVSSRAARTPANPLFPVNQTDHLIRHSQANHKRETIAFSKRRQGALLRMAIHQMWQNFVKHRSENRRDGPPAKALGLIERALTPRGILKERLFPLRTPLRTPHRMPNRMPQWVRLRGWLEACYFGRIETPAIGRNRTHRAKYAT